ncbi:MAG TPA: hypothetical protein PLD85_14170 [Spirochaetota bacterium]|nr:hypothetical protein [Spirochaetota bacterium]
MDEEQINTTGPNIVNHLRRLELLAAGYTPEEVGLNARLYLQKRADTDGNWRRII